MRRRYPDVEPFYRSRLSGEDAIAYDLLLAGFESYEDEVMMPLDVSAGSSDLWAAAWSLVLADHPEMFHVEPEVDFRTYTHPSGLVEVGVGLKYSMPAHEQPRHAEVCRRAREMFVSSLPDGATEYERVQAAYEYVIRNCEYDMDAPDDQNILSVFERGMSACMGYAKAVSFLLSAVGVENAVAMGYVNGRRKEGRHAWNAVKVDGRWCWLDATWGDPRSEFKDERKLGDLVEYDYLCVGDGILSRTHHADGYCGRFLPDGADGLDWHERNGLSLRTCDVADIERAVGMAISGDVAAHPESHIAVITARMSGKALRQLDGVYASYVRGGGLRRFAEGVYGGYGRRCADWSYSVNTEAGTFQAIFDVVDPAAPEMSGRVHAAVRLGGGAGVGAGRARAAGGGSGGAREAGTSRQRKIPVGRSAGASDASRDAAEGARTTVRMDDAAAGGRRNGRKLDFHLELD